MNPFQKDSDWCAAIIWVYQESTQIRQLRQKGIKYLEIEDGFPKIMAKKFPSLVLGNRPADAAAATKSLESYLTLCNPIDGSPPGSAVPRILQARTLEWAAISFFSAWKWKWSFSVMSHSSRPHGLRPTRLLRPWDFPGKGTGVGCHCLLRLTGLSSVQFSCSVISDSFWPHESQHTRPPCASSPPGVYSNSCPLSWWCHPAISSSVIPFSSCPQSLAESESFPMSQLFTWGGQSIGVSASASVMPRTDLF